ncbi:hypothetical protein BDR03DRAFT_536227 [Suillus americanus]|nr:hypothetical protein BDR03DRAFT_536227 [Suillus americanus]
MVKIRSAMTASSLWEIPWCRQPDTIQQIKEQEQARPAEQCTRLHTHWRLRLSDCGTISMSNAVHGLNKNCRDKYRSFIVTTEQKNSCRRWPLGSGQDDDKRSTISFSESPSNRKR